MQLQRDLAELQVALSDETQKVVRLQMELDAKESEAEHLLQKLQLQGTDTASVSSNNDLELDDSMHGEGVLLVSQEVVGIFTHFSMAVLEDLSL